MNDSLMVIKGYRLSSNLYQLDGTTITGVAAVGTENEVENNAKPRGVYMSCKKWSC